MTSWLAWSSTTSALNAGVPTSSAHAGSPFRNGEPQRAPLGLAVGNVAPARAVRPDGRRCTEAATGHLLYAVPPDHRRITRLGRDDEARSARPGREPPRRQRRADPGTLMLRRCPGRAGERRCRRRRGRDPRLIPGAAIGPSDRLMSSTPRPSSRPGPPPPGSQQAAALATADPTRPPDVRRRLGAGPYVPHPDAVLPAARGQRCGESTGGRCRRARSQSRGARARQATRWPAREGRVRGALSGISR